jgi:hypothetical protein
MSPNFQRISILCTGRSPILAKKEVFLQKLEKNLRVILMCSYFSESIDKSSNQTFSSKIIFNLGWVESYPVLEANIWMGKIGNFPIS